MKVWIKDKMQSDYMQRQFHMMGNLGLFYIILIALFAIPLMGTFVVVIIKGVLDFRYLILAGGIIITGLAIYFAVKFSLRMFRKIRRDGLFALREAQEQTNQGQSVQIGLMGGLLTLSYGGQNSAQHQDKSPLLLPEEQGESFFPQDVSVSEPETVPPKDPLKKIRELSDMKSEGIIDEAEFCMLKKKLIQDICNPPEQSKGK